MTLHVSLVVKDGQQTTSGSSSTPSKHPRSKLRQPKDRALQLERAARAIAKARRVVVVCGELFLLVSLASSNDGHGWAGRCWQQSKSVDNDRSNAHVVAPIRIVLLINCVIFRCRHLRPSGDSRLPLVDWTISTAQRGESKGFVEWARAVRRPACLPLRVDSFGVLQNGRSARNHGRRGSTDALSSASQGIGRARTTAEVLYAKH